MILAGDTIRPNMIYRVTAVLPGDSNEVDPKTIDIRASVRQKRPSTTSSPSDDPQPHITNGVEVAQAVKTNIHPGSVHNLLMKISTLPEGDYSLRVEGNAAGTAGGTLFTQETQLIYSPRFLSILIQLNKPAYNGGDSVRFRVVLLNMSLKPFNEPIDMYIYDPNG